MNYIPLLLSLSFCIFSQNLMAQHTVYLKNGSIIQGKILQRDTKSQTLKMQLSPETTITLTEKEISGIGKRKLQAQRPQRVFHPYYPKDKTFFVFAETKAGGVYPAISTTFGYRFTPTASIGGGMGIQSYQGGIIHPFFADFRGEFTQEKKRFKPMYYGQLGYGLAGNTQTKKREYFEGGLYWSVGLGYKHYTEKHYQWVYSVGFLQQRTHEIWDEQRRMPIWNDAQPTGTPVWGIKTVHLDIHKIYNRAFAAVGIMF